MKKVTFQISEYKECATIVDGKAYGAWVVVREQKDCIDETDLDNLLKKDRISKLAKACLEKGGKYLIKSNDVVKEYISIASEQEVTISYK